MKNDIEKREKLEVRKLLAYITTYTDKKPCRRNG